ncbi:XRE family transcriptional regulator [Chryseobacterium carnipullorum]|uniref:Helix-turn-helix n=2 Tax=Chryseobacterium carnipullorum TaxID=1124835 RepID=A0A376DTU1_CHRCU|nr:XRE family transcriptional regulator [Chryseobacterium carnipullorum]AZA64633.1 XRE family transcriptional regulator [Chryseobacterium carnipullorum]STC95525.1 Helix-turn-helix [Chryseobacterium carnipullorum]
MCYICSRYKSMLRIQEVLKEKNISQIELAERMKLSKEGLNKKINGNPTIKSLRTIAEAIDVDVRELIEPTKAGDNEELYIKRDGSFIPIGEIQKLKP